MLCRAKYIYHRQGIHETNHTIEKTEKEKNEIEDIVVPVSIHQESTDDIMLVEENVIDVTDYRMADFEEGQSDEATSTSRNLLTTDRCN